MPKSTSPVQREGATAPKPHAEASLGELEKIFDDARDLSIVNDVAASVEQLAALDKWAANLNSRVGVKLFALCAGMAVVTYVLASFLLNLTISQALFCYVSSTVVIGVLWGVSLGTTLEKLSVLQRLSDKEDCDKALRLAKSVPACEAYRQSVLKQGREFRVLDLTVMQLIESKVLEQARQEEARKSCRALHEIS